MPRVLILESHGMSRIVAMETRSRLVSRDESNFSNHSLGETKQE